MADTERLILQVDAAVALAQSNLRALASTMDTESKNYDRSVQRIEGSHRRMDLAGNQSRIALMEMQHTFRAFGDSVAAGQDPVRAFIMELGRIGQAAEIIGSNGALGGLGKFMGGPWGLVLSAAIAGIASFAMQSTEAAKSVESETKKLEENQKQTELAAKAKEAFERTAEGAAAAIHKETEELEKQNRTIEDNVRLALRQLEAQRATLALRRGQIPMEEALAQAELRSAHENVQRAERGDFGPEGSAAAIAAYQAQRDAADKVRNLQAEAKTRDIQLSEADRAIRMALTPIASEAVKRSNDPSVGVTNRTEDAIKKLHQAYAAGTITFEKMVAQEDKLTEARDRELKAIQEANRKPRNNGAAVERDAETAATRAAYLKRFIEAAVPGVTGVTTTAHSKYVAGTNRISDHFNGDAVDFRPPDLTSWTKDQARKLFESAGMKIRFNPQGVEQLFGPWMGTGTALGRAHQNHIHAGVVGTPPSPGTMEHRLEAAAEKQARDQEAYNSLVARAQEQLLNATKSRGNTAEQAEAIDLEGIYTERSRQQAAVQAMVAEKRITQDQADYLIAIYSRTASAKAQAASEKATERVIAEQNEEQRVYLSGMVTLLQLQEGLAITTAERRKVALQILQYEEDMARAALREKIAKEQDPATKRNLQSQLNQIDAQHPLKVAAINQRNADPLTSYMQQLKANTNDMNEALKGVEVDGLKSLEDGILGVINGTESLASAFKKMASSILADLARIAIEKSILSMISMLSGGGGYGGPADSIGSFDPGSGPGFSGMGFAAGGSPPPGMASLVGEKGPELFVPKTPGVIIPNHMLGGKGGGSDVIVVHIDKSELFDAHVEQVSGRTLAVAAPHIVAAAQRSTISSLSRRGING